MSTKRVRAEARVRRSESKGSSAYASVPAEVRDCLGAKVGDSLVFEQGSTWAAERAAAQGPYFIVTVKRAPAEESAAREAVAAPTAPLPSLAEDVRRRLDGRS
jgi:hypothetical protein